MKTHGRRNSVRNGQGSPITFGLIGIMLVVGALLVWSTRSRSTVAANSSGDGSHGTTAAVSTSAPTQTALASASLTSQVVTQRPPPATCNYCRDNLVGMTADEIGQYTLQYAQNNQVVRSGTPEILLSRPITGEEYPALGLGCPPDFGVIEQPPLDLVILRGDFDINRFRSSVPSIRQDPQQTIYLGYVFDLWVGKPTSWQSTNTGGAFRAALNDPSLPADENEPSVCPPLLLPSEITLHYGQAAPGFTTPPPLPTDIRPHTVVPLSTVMPVGPESTAVRKK